MKNFRKIWDQEKNEFLLAHKNEPILESYKLFCEKFPDADVTETSYRNQRSRIGAVFNHRKTYSTRAKPLLSEHTKKGYIRIKIAQPNVWMFKQHYVWMINTGHKPNPKTETVIFLDGNNRNFNFENLFLLPRNCICILNNPYLKLGIVKDNPEMSLINCHTAMLIKEYHNKAKDLGLLNSQGQFKDAINKRARLRNSTPERKEKLRLNQKKYYQKLKSDPIRFAIYQEKQKAYKEKWYKNKKKK